MSNESVILVANKNNFTAVEVIEDTDLFTYKACNIRQNAKVVTRVYIAGTHTLYSTF